MAYTFNGFDSTYVESNKDIILKDVVFANEYGDTIPYMAKQLGVKGTEEIHPSTLNVTLQEAAGCGWNADGGLEISKRMIETKQKKVNMSFCEDDLIGKFAEYAVRIGANQDAMPFEGEIVEGVVKSINKQVEKDIWNTILNELSIETRTSGEGQNIYERVNDAYLAIPESILEEAVIFLSPANFRAYVGALVEKNLYHYNMADGDLEEVFLPGSGVKVRKAKGMEGSNDIFATSWSNLIYGTDFLSNKEEVKVWYSEDNSEYRLKVRFNYGVQVAFPDLCVKFAAFN